MKSLTEIISNQIKAWRGRAEPGAYIISYPKSGRTWLRLLLGKVLCDQFQVDSKHMLDTLRVTTLARVLPTRFTHDGASMRDGCPITELDTSKTEYADKKIIVLVRDPRDIMVSCYFQATKRIHVYHGPISEFVRSDNYGIRKCVTFYNIWSENQALPKGFLAVRYEDMHTNPQGVLKSVLDFLGITNVEPHVMDRAIEFGRFDNMKKMEASGKFERQVLKPGNVNDQDSFKVRRGKVGGYADYLSQEDCQYLTDVIAQADCLFLNRYVHRCMKNVA